MLNLNNEVKICEIVLTYEEFLVVSNVKVAGAVALGVAHLQIHQVCVRRPHHRHLCLLIHLKGHNNQEYGHHVCIPQEWLVVF